MTTYRFSVEGRPTPKQRARARLEGHAYYAPRSPRSRRLTYPEYKELVQAQFLQEVGPGWRGPDQQGYGLTVCIRATGIHHGDVDNVWGAIADALEGLVWVSDAQIAWGTMERYQIMDDTDAGVDVEIMPLGGSGFIQEGGQCQERVGPHLESNPTLSKGHSAKRTRLHIPMVDIVNALRHEGNKSAAARRLGCSAAYIRKRLKAV